MRVASFMALLLDLVKQLPALSAAVFPALGQDFSKYQGDVGFNVALRRSGGTSNASHFATLWHPQTNGMVERFDGRIEQVLQSHHFHSGDELETTPHHYVLLYNQQLPQSA